MHTVNIISLCLSEAVTIGKLIYPVVFSLSPSGLRVAVSNCVVLCCNATNTNLRTDQAFQHFLLFFQSQNPRTTTFKITAEHNHRHLIIRASLSKPHTCEVVSFSMWKCTCNVVQVCHHVHACLLTCIIMLHSKHYVIEQTTIIDIYFNPLMCATTCMTIHKI